MIAKKELLYSGKSKSIYATDDSNHIVLQFRDDATAFNGAKKASLADKGKINNHFNAFIMEYLKKHAIDSHFERRLNETESLAKKVTIVPVECVVRNRVAGGLSKRLGIEEGQPISPPIFEFYLKNDVLGDPIINEEHIRFLNLATPSELMFMKETSLKVNEILSSLFASIHLILVDFKLEFGRYQHQLILADEITPDGCRIWDANTLEKFDKDRFRRDLGNVMEGYLEILKRLGVEC
jgi:phosphoribosylaminoimidazole-succinocarboxamide synthase